MKAPQMPKADRLVVEAGTHQAVLYDVWDLGWQEGVWESKPNILPKIMLAFEINERIPTGHPRANERFSINRRYTFSFGKKANLLRDIESWLNRKLTEKERTDFDIETMIGQNCLLNIGHTEKNDIVYANIISIMPIMKGMPILTLENKRGIPEWVQKIIDKQVTEEDATLRREQIAQNKSENQEVEITDAIGETQHEIPF
jgi:hypothetical protein